MADATSMEQTLEAQFNIVLTTLQSAWEDRNYTAAKAGVMVLDTLICELSRIRSEHQVADLQRAIQAAAGMHAEKEVQQ